MDDAKPLVTWAVSLESHEVPQRVVVVRYHDLGSHKLAGQNSVAFVTWARSMEFVQRVQARAFDGAVGMAWCVYLKPEAACSAELVERSLRVAFVARGAFVVPAGETDVAAWAARAVRAKVHNPVGDAGPGQHDGGAGGGG